RMRRAVNHDDGPAGPRAARGYLELHVHLADRDLLRRARRRRLAGRRAGYRGVFADLRDAADEEAALVLDGDRAAHEALRRLPVAWQCGGRYEDSDGERDAWHTSKNLLFGGSQCGAACHDGTCSRNAPGAIPSRSCRTGPSTLA